ncbi:kinetochor protein Mis14/NSL1 [Microdochium nivale]|nr:kinetochor protein Mis14/NSL1 [Microdochium nivale]
METQRKIELQAPDDLAYLLANVRRAAAQRIDEAFPAVEGAQDEDELRSRIERLVDEYITNTFTLAGPNLSINGLDIDPAQIPHLQESSSSSSGNPLQPEEVFEPFDARKRQRVEDLSREEEDLLRDIAHLKKSVPRVAASSWVEAARSGTKADEEALEAANQRAREAADNRDDLTEGKGGLRVDLLERQADVEAAYDQAVQGLIRLKRDMPAVVARMERARGAGEYVISGR